MRVALIVTAYNRPAYLAQCIGSLRRAGAFNKASVIIVDDASTDQTTTRLLTDAEKDGATVIRHTKNTGICGSLLTGIQAALDLEEVECIINLDADAIVRNDFLEVILEHHCRHLEHIVTGFYCNTLNKDGSVRHQDLPESTGYTDSVYRKSVGGINMAFSTAVAIDLVIPILRKCLHKGGNWDHQVCIQSMKNGMPIVCITESVVEHIGLESAMGHGTGGEQPDTADGFKALHLPQVTLIGVDCVNFHRLEYAAKKSMEGIKFGQVVLLTSEENENPYAHQIPAITSKEAYSRFMVKDLSKYITTEYALVIQYDGYVLNPDAWSDEFLKYDYIGAPWWYKDGKNVGNGGFSIRSKKLQDVLASDPRIRKYHPEDHQICRTYRRILERTYGIRYAPEPVARRFSIEGYKGDKTYAGQFGFHGHHIDKPMEHDQAVPGQEPLIISQFQGIGDILFSMELVRKWIQAGHKVIWPVITPYVSLNRQFPEITFMDMRSVNIDHEKKSEYLANGSRVIPLRWSEQILKLHYKDVMKAKYMLYGEDWREWRGLTWKRYPDKELELMAMMGVNPGDDFVVVNNRFRSDQSGYVPIKLNTGVKVVNVTPVPGFNMMDWALMMEHAAEIHTVSTGILYMIDVLDTTDQLHQYVRKPDERDFSFTEYLWGKKYHYHR